MTASPSLRRPVAYQVAVSHHVPQPAPDMAFSEAEWSDLGRSPRWPAGSWLLWAVPAGLVGWAILLTLGKAIANMAWAAVNLGG